MRSKAYRAVSVNRVDVGRLLQGREGQRLHVGLDVGKRLIWVMLRWGSYDFERPWKVGNPDELRLLVAHLLELRQARDLTVALEPTGTYGDALRQALDRAGIAPRRVSPKMARDFAEIFDGVPSQHDGKDAAVVAELAAQGRSWPWSWRHSSAVDQELEYEVDWLDGQRRQMMMWYGRLEASLTRHWPEATRLLKLNSAVLLRCLLEYGGPGGVAQTAGAAGQLQRWGRARLSAAKAQALVVSARDTMGVATGRWDEERLRRYAEEILKCRHALRASQKRIVQLAKDNAVLQAQAEIVGVTTASVLWVHLGDPRDYHCGEAYGKAMGLNLAERSSGRYQGKLKISKRGPATVRRWLYLAALRWVRREPVKSWYAAQKAARRGEGKAALVGVMRKLSWALQAVGGRGERFDATRLYELTSVPQLRRPPREVPSAGHVAARDTVLGAGEP